MKTCCFTCVNTLVYICHYNLTSVSKDHALCICRMIALCCYRIVSLDSQSLNVGFYYRHALLCIDRCLFSCFWVFSLFSVTLKANNVSSMKKWIMLSVSCNCWDTEGGTEEQSEISQKDQILTIYVTSCGSKVWGAVILIKSLGGELRLVMSLNTLVSFVETFCSRCK